jgi:hypothetical protein
MDITGIGLDRSGFVGLFCSLFCVELGVNLTVTHVMQMNKHFVCTDYVDITATYFGLMWPSFSKN